MARIGGMSSSANARDLVAAYVRERDLGPGARLPAERALAMELGISPAAINRAILFHLGQGFLRREGYKLYTASPSAPLPARRLWAFISEDIPRKAAQEMARTCGVRLTVPNSREENHVRKALLELHPGDADGLLLWGSNCHDLLPRFEDAGVPVMVAGASSSDFPFVTPEHGRFTELAVEHLVAFGHEQIALITFSSDVPYGPQWQHLGDRYAQACHRYGLPESASRTERIPTDAFADVAGAWNRLGASAAGITGIVCPNPRMAQHLVALARKAHLAVPEDLSLVSLGDPPSAAAGDPPLTAISDESASVARIGLLLLNEMAGGANRDQRRRFKITLEPSLLPRDSSAARPGGDKPRLPLNSSRAGNRKWPHASNWSTNPRKRAAEAEAINQKPFPGGRTSLSQFSPIDITRQANRACAHEHSWLGDEPLRNIPTGEVIFHGVPFRLINERENNSRGAIVVLSRKAHTSAGRPLPTSLTVPIRRRAEAIYILHAAGWSRHHQPFAEYSFPYDGQKGEVGECVNVVPYADLPPDHPDPDQWREESNIQDWHPIHTRFESAHAMPCVITENGDPLLYERYLYAWRWINPHPELKVSALRIRTLDPSARATLAVLAVTVQKSSSED